MAISKIQSQGITDSAVTSAKIGVDVIVAEDVAANAITVSELQDNAVTSAKIADGAIVNADVNASAAIAASKLDSTLVTHNSTSFDNSIVRWDGTAGRTLMNGWPNIADDGTLNVTGGSGNLNVSGDATVTGNVIASNISAMANNIAILAFKLASANSLAAFKMQDQVIDEFVDATGIDTSASTNEILSSGYYGGGETVTVSGNYDSSGVDGNYTWYKWTTATSSGSYTTDTAQDYEYLVIAGGGGAGGHGGSGGGAGGYRTATGFAIGATTISGITVGAGGAGGSNASGTKGNNSVFSSITSTGGGLGGGGGNNANNGGAGGSGGGGRSTTVPAGNEGSFSPVEGYAGGTGITGSNNWPMGGGGGASEVGNNGTSGSTGGDGGDGRSSSIDGTATTRAGGGGGSDQGNPGGVGGAGGGGNAGNGLHVTNGTANTGSGGGGQHAGAGSGGTGGSGIVIIRRPTGGIDDLSLVSTTTTAESTPTTGDIVMLIEDQTGTATINTDVLGYISRNAGTNWSSAVTFVDEGDWGTNKRILVARDVDISSLTGTTSMRYKIATANQSASKATRIHAISLAWA